MLVISILVFALAWSDTEAQWGTIENGTCPEFNAMENFDLSRWYGRWYDIFHCDWYFGGSEVACVTADYTEWGNPEENGLLYHSANSMNLRLLLVNTPIQVNSFVYDTGVPGQFITQFGPNPPTEDMPSNFNVIDTDFDSYTCIFNCVQLEEGVKEHLALAMSRTSVMDETARTHCESIFTSLDVTVSKMVNTKQDDKCIYYPEP